MNRKEKQPLTFLLGKSEAVFEITIIFYNCTLEFISYAIGIVVTVYSVTSNV